MVAQITAYRATILIADHQSNINKEGTSPIKIQPKDRISERIVKKALSGSAERKCFANATLMAPACCVIVRRPGDGSIPRAELVVRRLGGPPNGEFASAGRLTSRPSWKSFASGRIRSGRTLPERSGKRGQDGSPACALSATWWIVTASCRQGTRYARLDRLGGRLRFARNRLGGQDFVIKCAPSA